MRNPVPMNMPQPGFWARTFVKGGPLVPVRIWKAVTPDPWFPDNPMDRSAVLHCTQDGKPADVYLVWPWCCGHPLDEREYAYLLALRAHVECYEPNDPLANPARPIDMNQSKVIF